MTDDRTFFDELVCYARWAMTEAREGRICEISRTTVDHGIVITTYKFTEFWDEV